VFSGVNPLMQAFWRVVFQHRNGLLTDDRTRIHARIHEMHGATGEFHAMIQRLFPRFEPWKRRQQRRMHIHDSSFKRAKKIPFEHAHKSGEHNQIHLRPLQGRDKRALRFFVQLGAEFSRRDELRGEFSRAGVFQNPRAFDIAQYNADFCGNASCRNRIGNRDEIGPFARAEHTEAEFFGFSHTLCLQAGGQA